MLRFNHSPEDSKANRSRRSRVASRQRRSVWMLLIALGLVLLTMRQLNQPETAQRLEQIFSSAEQPDRPLSIDDLANDDLGHLDEISIAQDANRLSKPPQSEIPTPRQESAHKSNHGLEAVRDNTYFRTAESEAWFGLFEDLQAHTQGKLKDSSLGELTYTQLLKQPDYYRGKAVTVSGTVRRQELENAPDNALDIRSYHRLWVEPSGGSNWPFVVYCLELPKEFPRGDQLNARVSVTGYFFKNWSYAYRDGLGIAPVVLASGIDWQPVTNQSLGKTPSERSLTVAMLIAGGFAAVVVYLVLRNTRRVPHPSQQTGTPGLEGGESNEAAIHEQLQNLAAAEAEK